jgi:hypothetical protein
VHVVSLARKYSQQLLAGEPLAAWLATSITSPDQREAVLAFWAASSKELPLEFYLNGQRIEEIPGQTPESRPRLHNSPRRKTAPLRLRAGENSLLIRVYPPQAGEYIWPTWFFGAALETPKGELLTDLGVV